MLVNMAWLMAMRQNSMVAWRQSIDNILPAAIIVSNWRSDGMAVGDLCFESDK